MGRGGYFFHFKTFFHLLVLGFLELFGLGLGRVQTLRIAQIVHSNGQKHVEQNVVANDENEYEIEGCQYADRVDAAVRTNARVHYFVPIFTCQNL